MTLYIPVSQPNSADEESTSVNVLGIRRAMANCDDQRHIKVDNKGVHAGIEHLKKMHENINYHGDREFRDFTLCDNGQMKNFEGARDCMKRLVNAPEV